MPLTLRRRMRAGLLAAASAAVIAATSPSPIPLGIGDPLFPHLGNPGYDVLAYDIALDYSGDNTAPLDAVTVLDARALTRLQRINLDFDRGTVTSVEVDGEPAAFARAGEDLVVTPDAPVEASARTRITVKHTSVPTGKNDGGWVRTGDGLVMANQADAAHRVFPCNDHPSDKAMFTFRITTRKPDLTAVASGLPIDVRTSAADGAVTAAYRTSRPMATELAQVSIGRNAVVRRTGPHGLPLRDVVRTEDRETIEPWLAKTPDHLRWMESRVGRYPFETYGVLAADVTTGFALETQTLSLFERRLFTEPRLPAWYVESIMVHELAHHWFGNSVSPRNWSDLWLSEGHATWYEALFTEDRTGRSLQERMRNAYRRSDQWRAAGGPPAAPEQPAPGRKLSLFRPVVYDGSALVLYALRAEIGQAAFDRLERSWVGEHAHGSASTADFVRLASRTAARDLTGFFQEWLYARKTPAMPGHPDWTSDAPAEAGGKAAKS
ncbi:M1 family metallopeptidase [Streptomyces sp. NPDC060194]|uniref:M1 family metallopeptidase n=1 Tax=Streptomyces sp. NPDC060194 TaxID=3347069 RepID=UPI00366539EC